MRPFLSILFSLFISVFFSAAAHALVVLQYHHISNTTPRSTSTSPELFAQHLEIIASEKFQVVSIEQLKTWLHKGERLPDKTVVITFDDGYRSVYTAAFPLLKKRGWPFTVFVNTQAHDGKKPQFMSWGELKTLATYGAVIGNHTDSHPHLIRQRKHESHKQWLQRREQEINFAEMRIKKEIGESHKVFAYPYGEYDENLTSLLKRKGYIAFGQQSGPVAKESHHQVLPRFPFGGAYGGPEDFLSKLTSLPFPMARLKVTTESGAVLYSPELPQGATKPVLRVASPMMNYLNGLNCYASGQGKIKSDIKGGVLVAQTVRPLPPGRSRYNCTAQAGGGRFYWLSQLFIRRLPNGDWVKE
ncbi:MAG: polysaccharide deacetylase family protein [Agarilytica sp.]